VSGLGNPARGKCRYRTFNKWTRRWHRAFTEGPGCRMGELGSMHRDAMAQVGVGASASLARVEGAAKADFAVESWACRMNVARRTRKGAV
jgi:hypothetical protein